MKKILLILMLVICLTAVSAGCSKNTENEPDDTVSVSRETVMRSWSIEDIRSRLGSLAVPVEDIDFKTELYDKIRNITVFRTYVEFSGNSGDINSVISELCTMENENLFLESIKLSDAGEKHELAVSLVNPTGLDKGSEDTAGYIKNEWANLDRSGLMTALTVLHKEYSVKGYEASLMLDGQDKAKIKLAIAFSTQDNFKKYQTALSEDGRFELSSPEALSDTEILSDTVVTILTDQFNK